MSSNRIIIIGAGLAGLSAAVALSAAGEEVVLLEKEEAVGGKMRQQWIGDKGIDAGPTVLTMKWVFDQLFEKVGSSLEAEVGLTQAETLARHAWSDAGTFDLFADEKRSEQSVGDFFGARNAIGYKRFCKDAAAAFATLKDTYIAAPAPSPAKLAQRVGYANAGQLIGLKPFHSLWRALNDYFPDKRLRQLFGRYATYVGSSPYLAPATLMLIAHVEQAGVWFVNGGMHALARAMAKSAQNAGAEVRTGASVAQIMTQRGRVSGVSLESGEVIEAGKVPLHILFTTGYMSSRYAVRSKCSRIC
ncbi:MAG: FAD-dependent oxidoreductase [Pseudomonadota bacterium]